MSWNWLFVRINLKAYSDGLSCFLSKFRTTLFFFEFVNHFFIDKSRAAHLWVGCVKTVFHLWVEIMVLLSMISDCIFVRINLNAYSDSLSSFVSKLSSTLFFFEFVNHFFIDKRRAAHLWVGCAKTVIHLRVEIMVLLSMGWDWIFVRINLNAYSYSLRCSFVLKFSAILFFQVCKLLFYWH